MSDSNLSWEAICATSDLTPMVGARALFNNEQVALFKVKEDIYAVNAIDPFTNAAVLARGIVGDLEGKIVVASPLLKQHFDLVTGQCLEDESVSIKTYAVREKDGKVELGA